MRRCLQLYSTFPFAHFQMAMFHVARQDLDTATQVLEEGVAVVNATGTTRSRFPASGLHWLLGSIRLVRDDVDGARSDFERELNSGKSALYAAEFSVGALNGRGFALLRGGQVQEAESGFFTVAVSQSGAGKGVSRSGGRGGCRPRRSGYGGCGVTPRSGSRRGHTAASRRPNCRSRTDGGWGGGGRGAHMRTRLPY